VAAHEQPIYAVEYVRGFSTSTRPQLLRCSNGCDYLVKFKDNRIGPYTAANEWICYRIASHIRLPVPQAALITVTDQFIQATPQLCSVTGTNHLPEAGLQFGSAWIHQATQFSSKEEVVAALDHLSNRDCVEGIILFDRWLLNADRQAENLLRVPTSGTVRIVMIDHGHCLGINGHSEWVADFSPVETKLSMHPLRSFALPERHSYWSTVIASVDDRFIGEVVRDLPSEWNIGREARARLAAYLCGRKTRLTI
jgi:hypothetical protein